MQVLLAQPAPPDPAVPLEEQCSVSDCVEYNQSLYYALTGADLNLSWGTYQNELDTYDVVWDFEILEFPPKANQLPVVQVRVTDESTPGYTWVPSKAGLYWGRVRACFADESPEPCSRWSMSLDPVDTDPVRTPRGFFFAIALAAPGGGGIE
jgi:hypothetical protein